MRDPQRSMRFQWSDDRFSFLFGYDSSDNVEQKSILMNYAIHNKLIASTSDLGIPLQYYSGITHRIDNNNNITHFTISSETFNNPTSSQIITYNQSANGAKYIDTLSGPAIAEIILTSQDNFAIR